MSYSAERDKPDTAQVEAKIDTVRIHAEPVLDTTACDRLRGLVHDACRTRPLRIELVLGAVEEAGVCALAMMVDAARAAAAAGAELSILEPTPDMVRLLRVSGLHKALPVDYGTAAVA